MHNVVDVSLPSTYRFIGKVFDEIQRLYAEAGVPLETINISGDEVAEGCWLGSPSCQRLMEENGWTSSQELWSHFLGRMVDMLSERGLKFAGYAEVV
ncbi:MAG: family 20 glycosylhydrolase, partial [Bacteroidales bacterium]|nr:family 20 glycosylhydrolase [Bacteroidales bacterium]